MIYHRYLLILLINGVTSWVAWLVVLNKFSPLNNLGIALLFFMITLFIALVCTFTLFIYYFRHNVFENSLLKSNFSISFRQGLFLSFIFIFALVFQLLRVLTWWSGLLLIIAILLLEYYFSLQESNN